MGDIIKPDMTTPFLEETMEEKANRVAPERNNFVFGLYFIAADIQSIFKRCLRIFGIGWFERSLARNSNDYKNRLQ
jgi:hypothetical protein